MQIQDRGFAPKDVSIILTDLYRYSTSLLLLLTHIKYKVRLVFCFRDLSLPLLGKKSVKMGKKNPHLVRGKQSRSPNVNTRLRAPITEQRPSWLQAVWVLYTSIFMPKLFAELIIHFWGEFKCLFPIHVLKTPPTCQHSVSHSVINSPSTQ